MLIDFDGPVCQVFAGIPSHVVADELRSQLRATGINIPPDAATLDDPRLASAPRSALGGPRGARQAPPLSHH